MTNTTIKQPTLWDAPTSDTNDQAPADAKGLRELLLAGLIAQIKTEIATEEPDFDQAEYHVGRSGSTYWQAYYQAKGMRVALGVVERALATHEEYLIADRERTRRTWTETERECARHRDTCPHCAAGDQAAWRTAREVEHLEAVRRTYVEGLHELLNAVDARESRVTLPQVVKALKRIQSSARRLWERGPKGV